MNVVKRKKTKKEEVFLIATRAVMCLRGGLGGGRCFLGGRGGKTSALNVTCDDRSLDLQGACG